MSNNETTYIEKFKDDPFKLFKKLHEIWRDEIKTKDKKTTKIILKFNKEQSIDFCDFAVKAMDNGFNCFDTHNILEDAIPLMELNVKSMSHYLSKIFDGMHSDVMSGRQYSTIANLAKEQPDFSRKLLDNLIGTAEPFVAGYLATIYMNLPNIKIEDLHSEILNLISHSEEFVVQGAVIVLGRLKYDIQKNKEIIRKTFDIFDELLTTNVESISQAVVCSLSELYYLGDEAKSRLLDLSKKNNPDVCYHISKFLFLNYKNLINDDWFKQVLMTLSATKCQYNGITHNLDYILYGLLDIKEKQSLAVLFFTEWLLNSDFVKSQMKLESIFSSTLSKLSDDTMFFNSLITKYLNHDNSMINRVASELIRYSNLYKKRPIILDQSIINSLGIDDIIYICRKILGYLFEVKTLCSTIYSILAAKPNDLEVKALIQDIFLNQIGIDHPGTTLKFLKGKLSTTGITVEIESVLKDMISVLESRQKKLISLPRLNELLVPEKLSYQIALEENKKMSNAMEKAQEGSIVSMVATRIPLKYGRSWFSYKNGEYSIPSRLTSYSHSFEIPRSEIDHPVNASLKRASFRKSKRGD